MADSSRSWWKVTFLRRKKSQSKVLYEMPAESVSSDGGPENPRQDPQLDARLEQIVDKTSVSKGRHVKVSHSGRFKVKKRVRATLSENPHMSPGEPGKGENLKAGP